MLRFRQMQAVRWLALGAALFCLKADARADEKEASKARVSACGLRIVAEPYGGADEMRAFNWFPGVTVVLQVAHPGGGLIGFDEDGSKLDAFTDDQGNSLVIERDFVNDGFSAFPRFSSDAKVALVELNAAGIPAAKARELRAKGTLVFRRATKPATVRQENVSLKKGTQFEVGPFKFKIENAGKPDWGEEPLAVELQSQQNLDAIKAVKFLDAQGQAIESNRAGRGSFGMPGSMTYSVEYNLAREVETVTMEIAYWENIETVEVPFDLKVGVGMSPPPK